MRLILTPAEITQFRSEWEALPEALAGLDVIEDCDGDVEDAALVLAIRAGQQPQQNDRWLESIAKRWRPTICKPELRGWITTGKSIEVLKFLSLDTAIPPGLATPILIHVLKMGIEEFCRPLEEKL